MTTRLRRVWSAAMRGALRTAALGYPRRLRARFGQDLDRILDEELRDTRGAVAPGLRLIRTTAADVLRHWMARPEPTSGARARLAGGLAQDVRVALRRLRASPGSSLVALSILILATGVASTFYAIAHATLVAPLPVPDPDRFVYVRGQQHQGDGSMRSLPLSFADLDHLATSRAFAALSPLSATRSFNLRVGEVVEHVEGELVGADYFALFGGSFSAGRAFTHEEAPPGAAERVAVISHALWTSRFAAQQGVLGRRVSLNDLAFTVIGVAPPGFAGLTDDADVWLPIGAAGAMYGAQYVENADFRWLRGVARIAPDLSIDQAGGVAVAAMAQLEERNPDGSRGVRVELEPVRQMLTSGIDEQVQLLLTAGVSVLLIACVNLAGLALARGRTRRPELAMRVALGASRWRLMRLALVELLVIAVLGAAGGLVVASFGIRLIAATPLSVHTVIPVSVSPIVIGAALGATALSLLTFGLLPAWLDSRAGGGPQAGAAGRSTRRIGRRFQATLIGAEVAMAVLLVASTVLAGRGLARHVDVDLGFSVADVVTARLDLTGERYAANQRLWSTARQIVEHVAAVPGVTHVALEGPGHPLGLDYGIYVAPDGADVRDPRQRVVVERHHVVPGYFATLEVPLVSGREFAGDDQPGGEIAVILSQRLARQLWPDGDAVGARMHSSSTPMPLRVVGIAPDVRQKGLGDLDGFGPDIYINLYQWPPRAPALLTILARTAGRQAGALQGVVAASRRAAPDLPPFDAAWLGDLFRDETEEDRFGLLALGAFAGLAVLLAAVGVAGTAGSHVADRRREVGIRLALGAKPGRIVRQLALAVSAPAVAGLAIGLLSVPLLDRLLDEWLYGLPAADPVAIAVTAAVLGAAVMAASVLPARRATNVDPARTLRAD